MTHEISDVLEQRGRTHGPFRVQFVLAQQLKALLRVAAQESNYPSDPDTIRALREATDMIAVKLSRIVAGDPLSMDAWLDIEGYARLARRAIELDGEAPF